MRPAGGRGRFGVGAGLGALVVASLLLGCVSEQTEAPSQGRIARQDDLSALWSFYKFHYIQRGRVVSLDEDDITTSEGQGYAMLRAVWSDDPATFASVWDWTKAHLQIRDDRLFAWKWKGRVLDIHSATDADTDIALALLLAARRWEEPVYEAEALEIIDAIWHVEVVQVGDAYYPTAGDWAKRETVPTLHVAYLAPYAYAEFAKVDSVNPWKRAIETSYDLLHWLYSDQGVKFPPELVYVDPETGALSLEHPRTGAVSDFSYDAFPIFWRVALDAQWHGRWQGDLRETMLAPLRSAYDETGHLYDRYTLAGQPESRLEALPLYATAHSLASVADPAFADRLEREKLDRLWTHALVGKDTPYYLHNWLWFDRALVLDLTRRFDEFLAFLRPFDSRSFWGAFPAVSFLACLVLFPLARFARGSRWRPVAVVAFLLPALWVCVQYLAWRGQQSLNFIEPAGPYISVALWVAELYCFFSVLLLVAQVGVGAAPPRKRPEGGDFQPSVDVLIPIFREPLEILERTLLAARAMRYPRAEIFVLDDGHREDVRRLAERLGARYLRGPQRHAKAGNLNAALPHCRGDLFVVFDTDHIPVRSFLEETVPWFHDPQVGFVQTPHHFGNPDIFQRAFRVSRRIPNEQDMFNHGIQSRRDGWGGAFFVGSGAVFRRSAIDEIGGFKVASITEDIHTSQHLHAAGWRSVFVDLDLAIGLAAENFSSYLVQRRRWMLGCLQIFFADNPLLCRGLSWRHRIGYFASLSFFFFPLARVVFWTAPLAYLLFHLHPILAEVSVLTALLIPYLVVLPMISSVLVPNWPRPFWGSFYEGAVSAPLAVSMLDLLLPKSLGFVATPKGLVADRARFDWRSSAWTMLLSVVTLFAIGKGLWEFHLFGIEKDAYFFNLTWAGVNLSFLIAALMVAWERPQQRGEHRVRCTLPTKVRFEDKTLSVFTDDVSLSGCALLLDSALLLPREFELEMEAPGGRIALRGRLVYHDRVHGQERVGVRFEGLGEEARRHLLLSVWAESETWARAHAHETRSQGVAALAFVGAVAGFVRRPRARTRRHPRSLRLRRLRMRHAEREHPVLLWASSPLGLGVVGFGSPPRVGTGLRLSLESLGTRPSSFGRVIHARRRLGLFWSVGIECLEAVEADPEYEVELAA